MKKEMVILNPSYQCAVTGCSNAIHEGQTIYLSWDEIRSIFLCTPCFNAISDMAGKK